MSSTADPCTCRPDLLVAGLASASCPVHGLVIDRYGPPFELTPADRRKVTDQALADHAQLTADRTSTLEASAAAVITALPVLVFGLLAFEVTWWRFLLGPLPLAIAAVFVFVRARRARVALAAAAERLRDLAEGRR